MMPKIQNRIEISTLVRVYFVRSHLLDKQIKQINKVADSMV